MGGLKNDLTGSKIADFIILKDGIRRNRKTYCLCKCICGNIVEVRKDSLTRKHKTHNCGCKAVQRTHGLSHERIHTIWSMMKQRCTNSNHKSYKNYGGKGISVCKEWLNFETFKDWAFENGYNDDLTLDRINGNKNYCPENCRWATYKQQGNNRNNNRLLTFNNQTHTMQEWCDITGLSKATVYERLKAGWDIKRTLETPNRYCKPSP